VVSVNDVTYYTGYRIPGNSGECKRLVAVGHCIGMASPSSSRDGTIDANKLLQLHYRTVGFQDQILREPGFDQ